MVNLLLPLQLWLASLAVSITSVMITACSSDAIVKDRLSVPDK
jgi:hypothetical protein